MSPVVKNDTSKRLGSLLLCGWTMLAENCPNCQVPLMKERMSDQRLCVNCDTTFVPDSQGLRPSTRPLQSLADVEPEQEQEQQQEDAQRGQDDSESAGGDGALPYDPRADPRLGPFASATTERSADANLERHSEERLSTAECLGSSNNGGVDSVAAALSSGPSRPLAAAANDTAPTPDSLPTPNAFTAPPASCSRATPSAGSFEDVADLLAAKMLQGWALLDKYCPRCTTVLVRSKVNKRMFCVACDAWVLTETDAEQRQQLLLLQQQQPHENEKGQQQQLLPRTTQVAAATMHGSANGLPQASIALLPQQQEQQCQPQAPPQPQAPLQQQQRPMVLPQPQAARPLPTSTLGSHTILASGTLSAAGVPSFSSGLQQHLPPLEQQQPQRAQRQLPLMYQQFFTPVAPAANDAGVVGSSRGSSPPNWVGGGPTFSHETLVSALRAPVQQQQQQPANSTRQTSCTGPAEPQGVGAGGVGGGGSNKQPSGTAMLLSIGRTVALKMAEAQGQLERTPALDTERARAYVALISECLDLLSKLHSLQQ